MHTEVLHVMTRAEYSKQEVSIFFDIIFMCQHYLLYPAKKATFRSKLEREGKEPLVKSLDETASENKEDHTSEFVVKQTNYASLQNICTY
ncbi:cystinosin-like protein [Gossypium australe]|uniref:Cystinosin-like protein n=1 Tax=Gossypium australe TaxID=47621 RepID=A0A5B6W2K0_9ROSI|nr:cystinosin-like protein [Gossypium australe]